MKVRIGLLIILFIFHSLSDFAFKKRVLKNKFRSAQKLILLYTKSIGSWAKWIIIPAAFAAMFSTTITCLDAYPRSISAIQGLLRGTDFGHMDSKA